jgi:hypothetical protein
MKYNLRNLLWHMKHKGLKDEAERIAECKEQLYDAIEDNVSYFTNWKENCLSGSADICYSIPMSHFEPFWGLTLDKFKEIEDRFNKAATGLFGFQYDNCAHIVLTDLYGHPFKASCYYHEYTKSYELCVYSMNGQISLCRITTETPQLTKEQVKEMEKCHDNLMEYYEKQKASTNRYQQICKYKDYIRADNYTKGYAQYTCDVYVRKDIPIELTEHEIAKYIDDWNYCFGGKICASGETGTELKYKVTVYTD